MKASDQSRSWDTQPMDRQRNERNGRNLSERYRGVDGLARVSERLAVRRSSCAKELPAMLLLDRPPNEASFGDRCDPQEKPAHPCTRKLRMTEAVQGPAAFIRRRHGSELA